MVFMTLASNHSQVIHIVNKKYERRWRLVCARWDDYYFTNYNS